MIVSAHFGTAFTRPPPIWRFIGLTDRNPFPTQFFSFCPVKSSKARTTKVAFFRRQSKLQKWDVEIHG
jgi:hypothetical protein